MADTTINVSGEERDRLAVLAAERGSTIRDLVGQFAEDSLTVVELEKRRDTASAYVKAHLVPDFGPADLEAGEALWQELVVGRPSENGDTVA